MSIFQGTVAPDVNTTKTNATTAPQYYGDYLSGIAAAGTEQLGKSGADLVAGFTDLQKQGISGISGAALSYKPGISGAASTASTAAGGLNAANIQAMMNPFQTNVVNEMERLSNQQMQRNLLPALKGAFTSTGGLGSQRMMGALGQMGADVSANLTGLQAKELSTGYQNAVANALKNLEQQRLGATTQADIAAKEQELGLTGQNAMIKTGALEQAQNQALLDAPMKRAKDVADLMRGYNVPVTTTEKYTGPMAGVYGNSILAQLGGLGTMLGALNTGTSGNTPLNNLINSISAGISGFSGSWADPTTWFNSTPSITSSSDGTVNSSGVWGNNAMTGGTVIDNGTGGQADTTP